MVIAIDFDGTIVTHEYPKIGKEIPFAIDTIKRIQRSGKHQLILWTVRSGELLDEAVEFCAKRGVEFYAVNKNHPEEDPATASRKLAVDLFVDDRSLGGIPDWGIIYNMIESGDPFNYNAIINYNSNKPQKKKNFFIRLGEALDGNSGQSY